MNRTIPSALTALAVLGATVLAPSRAQAQAQGQTQGVRDRARMFSPEAVRKADEVLREVKSAGSFDVLIETRESLDGRTPREVAVANAEQARLKGLSVLISKQDRKVWTEPSGSAEQVFSKAQQTLVNEAFTRGFRKGDFDQGLTDAVAEIRRAVVKTGVRDQAKMFSAGAVQKADETLEAIRGRTKWGVLIETVDSLGGKSPHDAAIANARKLQVHGLYVLIAKNDRKLYAEPSKSATKTFTPEKIRAIDDAITSAFKAKDFDKGLLDAVEAIRHDTEGSLSENDATSRKTKIEAPLASASLPKASTPRPPAAPAAPSPAPSPSPVPIPVENVKKEGSVLPFLLMVGGGLLLGLWLISKVFRRPQPQQQPYPPNAMAGSGGGYAPGPGYAPGAGAGYPASPPAGQPGVPPGYAPRPGPAQAPGYGYAPPPPGYGQGGYGAPMPPPQQGGGGGFISGALGGAAGAVAGNILYDKFGRPHESQGPGHVQGGVIPHQQPSPLPSDDTGAPAGPPPEQYDPNAGAGADWGTPEPAAETGAGADWGTPEPAPEPDAGGGDWGGGGNADQSSGGGDWGESDPAPDPAPPDSGGGDDQGGNW
ncbi:MAG: hypothetical protein NVSMB9_13630 [Isosphaeraceae bacterium]